MRLRTLGRRLRCERGLTFVELLIVMPMLTVLLAGMVVTLTTLVRWNDRTTEEAVLQTEARAALTRLDGELRQAYVGGASSPIVSASADSITFYSPDRDPTVVAGGSETSFHLQRIVYTLSGGTLERQVTTSTNAFPDGPPWTWPATPDPSTTVLGSITNGDVFSYFTAAGAQASPPTPLPFPIADPSSIRVVGIRLALSTGGGDGRAASFTVSDTASLREMDQ